MKLFFYLFTVSVNKCNGSYKTIDDPYAQVCVCVSVKVFNFMSGVNEKKIFNSTWIVWVQM